VADAPVVRDAGPADVAGICAFGETHIRPHYTPLIGAGAADAQVRHWWNETAIGAAVAAGLVVVADTGGQVVGVGQRGRNANERAGAFYEREGFPVERIEPRPTDDPGLGVVWRVRPLTRTY
jgi:hypothetical protein